MGLLIPHFTAPSSVHGTGLFSAARLAAGTVLWCYQPGLDRRVLLRRLTPDQRQEALHYGYINPAFPEHVVICGDQARFWNFPPAGCTANACVSTQQVHREALIVAARAISVGEELLIEPASDADYQRKMLPLTSCAVVNGPRAMHLSPPVAESFMASQP
ncbi:MAG: hypothetical protein RLZZ124_102 [Cyanobacteriota bacterium]|jgi:SET domain-containing protein